MTTNQIAIAIKSNTQTVNRWVELIKTIQLEPRVIVESSSRITLVRLDRE